MASRSLLLATALVLAMSGAAFADSAAPTGATPSTSATAPATAAPVRTAMPAPSGSSASAAPAPSPFPTVTIQDANGATLKCKEQAAQAFLIRSAWLHGTPLQTRKNLEAAIKYRTEKYGYFEGFGSPSMNKHPPRFYAKGTSFMGLNVQINEKVIPALKCVEAALKASGADAEYHPHSAGGIRYSNTYRGFEVSNHVYGIAIDIEPDKNSCCGCVAPWPDHPLCKNKKLTVYQRMAMPKSWVDVFERFGFYWLGHDVLQDTMHFEFLGDADQITEPATTASAPPSSAPSSGSPSSASRSEAPSFSASR